MKILHVNTELAGGAAWCAMRINKSLAKLGVESKMLFANGLSMPEGVEGAIAKQDKEFWYSNPMLGKVKHMLNRMPWYWDKEKADIQLSEAKSRINVETKPYTHHPFSCYKNIANHPLVEWADIIHLHWVSGFVDYPTFFKNVKKPIVWTLHDMHPSRGVMHFYSNYSVLPPELRDIDDILCKIKRKSVLEASNLNVVAISAFMEDEIVHSPVLCGFKHSMIHNGVDTQIFQPQERQERHNCFLFSSYDIWDNRKGLQRVIAALEKLKIPNTILVVVGANASKRKPEASFPIIEKGLITDQIELAKIYSQADYFINASYEEAFAQTPLEAMSCGTPVISTPCSGAKDLIRPFNGVICSGYDSNAIAEGLQKAINIQYNSNTIRQYIIENYEYSIIAQQYKDLYESILK